MGNVAGTTLLMAAMLAAACDASAQSGTPQPQTYPPPPVSSGYPAQSQPQSYPSPGASSGQPMQPQSYPSPGASSGQPMHWRVQNNTVQPVTPQSPQQPAPATAPQAPASRMQTPATMAPRATAPTPATKASTSTRRKGKASKTAAAEAPPQPPPPPTLDQQPPTPPQVRFQNGELTIEAQNATLAQILRAVQSQTGASVDIPSSANNERVATTIGPGQPSVVLNTLLNGSKFDYVILGVAGSPGAVQKVILTPRSNAPAATAQNTNPQPEESQEEAVENDPETEPTTIPPQGFRRPGGLPVQPPNQNGFNSGQNTFPPEQQGDNNNGGKTPEQLMQELQQMQQQQQQLQEQLNPANRPPQ